MNNVFKLFFFKLMFLINFKIVEKKIKKNGDKHIFPTESSSSSKLSIGITEKC